jgi:thiamine biosynthesis protein ThiI
MNKAIIIRYCEIHLKGKNRGYFEKLLKNNIKKSLKGISYDFLELHNRYLIENFNEFDLQLIEDKLKKIAGVHNYSLAYVTKNDFEEIESTVLSLLSDKSGTFKIETNRADKNFTPNSMEVSRLLGGSVLKNYASKLSVKVKNPDYTIYVDIREDGKTLIYTDTVSCMSGMPVGSSGKGLLLISGGIDSPVAGYMMAKRGIDLSAIHFASPPYTSERAEQKVHELLSKVALYSGRISLYTVPFTHIQEEIKEKCPEDCFTLIMRRFMMRIANMLAEKIDCHALITGESVAQVASQTMLALGCTDAVSSLPVFRPVIGMDKEEIITISRKINTFEISIQPYEDCCTVFTPKHPKTKPILADIEKAEEPLDIDALCEEAVNGIKKIYINSDGVQE